MDVDDHGLTSSSNSTHIHRIQLSNFPEGFPLGHVQLYAAAAAAAVGKATNIWVARAKAAPHRPVAGLEFDQQVVLHSNHPDGTPVHVLDRKPTALPWKGAIKPEAALTTSEGALPNTFSHKPPQGPAAG